MSLPGAGVVRVLLHDVADVVASIAVAGLSFPDPDLPHEARALADRAGELGLDEGAARLRRLAEALEVLAASAERAERLDRSGRALDAVQALVVWQRLFRAELDLLEVQAGLRRSEEVAAELATRRVWPVGFALRGDRLAIAALDDADGQPVVLLDALAEVDRLDPLGGYVISRLFQDRLRLVDVLDGVVELVEHPVGRAGGRRVFAPAYATRPRLRRPAGRPPRLPELVTSELGGLDPRAPGPGWARLVVVARGDRVAVRTESGVPVGLAPTPVLRTALTKLLVREGADGACLSAVLQHREGRWELLAGEDPLAGRCWPAWDPTAFGVAPAVLARRAPEGPDGLWLRAVAAVCGAEIDGIADEVRAAPAADPAAAVRLGWAARGLGVAREVDDALIRRALAGDERDVLHALWLAEGAGRLDELPLQALLDRRTAPVEEGDLPAIATRALLRLKADPDGLADALVPFVEAHVHGLVRALRHPDTPLPDLLDLVLLADVLATVRSADRAGSGAGPVVVPLGLPRDRLWRAIVDALHRWTRGGSAQDAADALLLAAVADLDRWIVAR